MPRLLEPKTPVSVRFCAIVAGLEYSSVVNALRRAAVPMRVGGLRLWGDVVSRMKGRIVSEGVANELAACVPPGQTSTNVVEIPFKLFERVKEQWSRLGVAGCPLLKSAERPRRGRPRKERAGPEEAKEEPVPVHLQIQQATLDDRRETIEYRKLQRSRLAGMMLDRATVEAGLRSAGRLIQREIAKIPAFVAGKIKQKIAIPDEKLREVEREVEGLIPEILRGMQNGLAELDRNAQATASAQRFGARGWSAANG